MPVVSVFEDCLKEALAGSFDVNKDTFSDLCFDFGLELDEVTSEKEMAEKERGENAAGLENASERVIYKIDVPANRYDLLCLEGVVRALKIFKGLAPAPLYTLSMKKPLPQMRMTVTAATTQIRPYVVAAILRNVTFDQDRYQSFIDLQDKLHQNICRKRSLVAIGTHDLDTLKPPFTYEALPPKDIWFRPLNQDKEMDGNGMMEVLSQHQQLKAYLPLIRDSPVYPVIYDSNRVVLSLPPIINGDHSKIKLSTKDVFIECTATDFTKANIVLNTVVAMFSEYSTTPFAAEPVEVVYADDYPANSFTKAGDKIIYPKLESRKMEADIDRMRHALSLEKLSSTEVRDFIRKMSVPCEVDKKKSNILNVEVPVTRSDIMHECDLIEDLAISYGYNNLSTEVPQTYGGAAEQPVNHLTDLLRVVMAGAGWTECYNWALLSRKENYDFLRREAKPEELWRPVARPHEYTPGPNAVELGNSKSKEFEIVRTSLLPGVLKCLASNKGQPQPIRLFEVSDVVIQEPTFEVGAKNIRRVCAVSAGGSKNFAMVHGLLDQLLHSLNVVAEHEKDAFPKKRTFRLEASDDPAFFPGRVASIKCQDEVIGVIGELHPEVLHKSKNQGFDIDLPTAAFELNIEPFLEWL
mmetsp:Transcript_12417/g.23392  ORF Transcript_12417/g.23392 Transcript_12417/m.23392 type:complete len:637 (+) Transcript_12417:104-2014(+)